MRLYDIQSRFSTSELTCPCADIGCTFGVTEKDIHKDLITKLNMLRILYGKPMAVTSGARCPAHNAKVGGKPNSAHLPHRESGECRAADIWVEPRDRFQFIELSMKVGFTRIGINNKFIHLDVAWDLPSPALFTY